MWLGWAVAHFKSPGMSSLIQLQFLLGLHDVECWGRGISVCGLDRIGVVYVLSQHLLNPRLFTLQRKIHVACASTCLSGCLGIWILDWMTLTSWLLSLTPLLDEILFLYVKSVHFAGGQDKQRLTVPANHLFPSKHDCSFLSRCPVQTLLGRCVQSEASFPLNH